jgi:hypothetical protein
MRHRYTPEQSEFIKKHVIGRTSIELLAMVNRHFGLDLNRKQIRAYLKNHNLCSGIDCTFKPGNVPFNKGQKGVGGGEPTQLKKGNKPANYRPVGSERVSVDGYAEIKVADPNKWRLKHAVIWEEVHGPVPKGHCLIFLDGNSLNISLDNLELVTRKQLARLNQNHLISDNPELTKTGLIIADIYSKIGERKKAK